MDGEDDITRTLTDIFVLILFFNVNHSIWALILTVCISLLWQKHQRIKGAGVD